jgi:hypothetical protein
MAKELAAMIGIAARPGRLDLPSGVIAVEHGQLDVHENQIGAFRRRLRDALSAVHGLDDRLARS